MSIAMLSITWTLSNPMSFKTFAKNVVTLFDSSCQYHTWLHFFRARALGSQGQIKKGAKNLLVLQKHCAQGHVAQQCWNQPQVWMQ